MRLQYPSNVKIIILPCTGKVDLIHILRAFEKGADGVYVVGCLEGACQYTSGNLRARKRVEQAREILAKIGVGGGYRCITFHRAKPHGSFRSPRK
jgi:F420-non-reducing hydrogenase iron-sulfur subunit